MEGDACACVPCDHGLSAPRGWLAIRRTFRKGGGAPVTRFPPLQSTVGCGAGLSVCVRAPAQRRQHALSELAAGVLPGLL